MLQTRARGKARPTWRVEPGAAKNRAKKGVGTGIPSATEAATPRAPARSRAGSAQISRISKTSCQTRDPGQAMILVEVPRKSSDERGLFYMPTATRRQSTNDTRMTRIESNDYESDYAGEQNIYQARRDHTPYHFAFFVF